MPRITPSRRAMSMALLVVPALALAQDTTKTFFTRHDLYWAGVGVGGGAIISIFDKRIANWTQTASVQGSASRTSFVKSLTVVNETPLTLGALATYGVGRIFGNETIA